MHNRLSLLSILLFGALCLLLSCSKNTPTPEKPDDSSTEQEHGNKPEEGQTITLPDGSVLKTGTKYFDDESYSYIAVLDTNRLSVSSNAPEQFKLAVGDIVLIPSSSAAKNGFMGKVVSSEVSSGSTVYHTESAPLDAVFEELHVDTAFDVFDGGATVVDQGGKQYEGRYLDPSFWEYAESGDYAPDKIDTYASTKGAFEGGIDKTICIPIEQGSFTGSLVATSKLSAKIDITRGKLVEYDITIYSRSYIEGTLGVSGELNYEIVKDIDFALPVGIPLGPIMLQPIISLGFKAGCSGEFTFGGRVYAGLSESTVRFHDGEYSNEFGDGGGFKIVPGYLDGSGEIEFKPRIALKFDVWGLKLLGFGIDAVPSLKLELSGAFHMNNPYQLKEHVEANISYGGSLGIFLYAKTLFGKSNDLRTSVDYTVSNSVVDLLDRGKDKTMEKEKGQWSVNADFGDTTLMSVDETGMSLFKIGDDEPLLSIATSQATKAGEDASFTFSIPGNPFQYCVRPYNRVFSETDQKSYHFYGNVVGDLVKSYRNYSFSYDEYGRLIGVYALDSLYETFDYQDNVISYTAGNVERGAYYFSDDGSFAGGAYTVNNPTLGGRYTISSGNPIRVSLITPTGSLKTNEDNTFVDYYTDYTFSEGHLISIYFQYTSIWNRDGSVLVQWSKTTLGSSSLKNPLLSANIFGLSFIPIPELTPKYLPSSESTIAPAWEAPVVATYSYSFDSKGRVSSINGTAITYYDEE